MSTNLERSNGSSGVIVSEPEIKENNVVFKKRRLKDNVDSFPYGDYLFI